MWRDHDGSQHARIFRRKDDAKDFLATVEADLVRGQYVDPAAGQVTLSAYIEEWIEAQMWRDSTRELADGQIRNHIAPALGERRLSQITRTDVQGFVRRLERQGLAPATVQATYQRLSAILESAVHDRRMTTSPATRIALPKRGPRSLNVVIPTFADIDRMADTVPLRLSAMVWVGAMAGLRPGEAAGLTVERVDLDAREITVDRQLVTTTGRPPHLTDPKTLSSLRIIPIPDALVSTLERHMEGFGAVKLEPDAHLLFTNRSERPMRRNVLGVTWTKAAGKLADGGHPLPQGANGWHSLRHYYASALIHGGLSVKAVQARLGHASATETLDTYSHLWPDSDDDTRAAVETALAVNKSALRR